MIVILQNVKIHLLAPLKILLFYVLYFHSQNRSPSLHRHRQKYRVRGSDNKKKQKNNDKDLERATEKKQTDKLTESGLLGRIIRLI